MNRDASRNEVAPAGLESPKGSPSPSHRATRETVARVWSEVLRIAKIGETDNFFELGGDSLKAMEVISRLQTLLNIELSPLVFFEDPTIAHLAGAAEQWQPRGAAVSPVSRAEAPLSFSQLTFWLLQQQDSLGYQHNQRRVLRIRGELRADVLQHSLDELCRRHQSLRTRFAPGWHEPVQVIDPQGRVELQFQDLSSLPASEREDAALMAAREEWLRTFHLSQDLPLRARLLQLQPDDHVLVVVLHHIVTDGYTSGIFFEDLSAIYNALVAGRPHALSELSLPCGEYAERERALMQGTRLEEELSYWRNHLEGVPASLSLPADRARPEGDSNVGEACSLMVAGATVERLKETARSSGSTLFTVLLGALRILLYRWADQPDIVIGTVASNRSLPGTERMIGCFVNFLPLRHTLSGQETALEVLNREKHLVMDAFAHQQCPFLQIAAATSAARTREADPVYNVALLLQNFPEPKFTGQSFAADFLDLKTETALLDLRFVAAERNGGLRIECEFKTALFDGATIENLLLGFAQVLEKLVASPDGRVSEFPLPDSLRAQADEARRREAKQTLAVCATFTAEPLADALAFWMKELGIRAGIEFAPYNQVFQQLLDPSSLLARNQHGLNVVLVRLQDWLQAQSNDATGPADPGRQLERNAADLLAALKSAAQRSAVPCIVCLCPASAACLADPKQAAPIESMEKRLKAELEAVPGVYPVASAELMELYPVRDYEDTYAEQLGHVPYTQSFFVALGTMIARRIYRIQAPPHKVIVLDCDNTLWRGICGEEGPRGVEIDGPRAALQEFVLAQRAAGMLVCLCSKNNEQDVWDVFEQNPGMKLRREHVAAWRINWGPKSENLRELARDLQLGLDSFIFLDDSAMECAEVESGCPAVLVLQLPEPIADLPHFLAHIWAFDHLKVTAEDAKRSRMYQENAQREELRREVSSLEAFLAGLGLRIQISGMDRASLPRVAQLTQRTNQFNCTTIRRGENEIENLVQGGARCLTVEVSDRFGDYGLVGVMICHAADGGLRVDTMLLSCRALGRRVEHEMISYLGGVARELGLRRVDIPFSPTARNQPAFEFLEAVAGLYREADGTGYVYRLPVEAAMGVTRRGRQDAGSPAGAMAVTAVEAP